jgi:hypothetical protein
MTYIHLCWLGVLALATALILLTLWSCLVCAKRADEQAQRMT